MLLTLKNIALPISNKQKKSQGSSIDATNLAAATHDNDTDFIVEMYSIIVDYVLSIVDYIFTLVAYDITIVDYNFT